MNELKPLDDLGSTLPPATAPPAGDRPFSVPRQPRIGIVHILVWTACTAVLLAGFRLYNPPDEISGQRAVFHTVTSVLNSILYGIALGGPILLVTRRLTGGAPFPVQPGHWLLVVVGFGSLISWLTFAGIRALERWNVAPPDDTFYLALGCLSIQVVTGVILACAGWWFRGELYWRLYFWMRVAFCIANGFAWLPLLVPQNASFAFTLVNWTQSCSVFVWGLWLVAAVIADWAKGERRDWLHWLGVAVSLGATVMYLISMLWYRFADAIR